MTGQFTGRVDWQLILRHCVMIQILDQEIRNSTCVNNSPLSTQYIIAVTMPYCWFPHPVHSRLWNLPSSPQIYCLLMRFKQCFVVPISLKSWDTWALVVFHPYSILPAMGRNGQNCKWNCKLLLPTSTFMWILREIWTGRTQPLVTDLHSPPEQNNQYNCQCYLPTHHLWDQSDSAISIPLATVMGKKTTHDFIRCLRCAWWNVPTSMI